VGSEMCIRDSIQRVGKPSITLIKQCNIKGVVWSIYKLNARNVLIS